MTHVNTQRARSSRPASCCSSAWAAAPQPGRCPSRPRIGNYYYYCYYSYSYYCCYYYYYYYCYYCYYYCCCCCYYYYYY